MPVLRILHISDLHFRDGQNWDSSDVLVNATNKIKEILASERRPDLVAITGDIAFAGKAAEYQTAYEWISRTFLDRENFDPANILIVPGNHDVDRNLVSRAATAVQSELIQRDDAAYTASIFSDPADASLMLRRLSAYLSFADKFPSPFTKHTSPPCWVANHTKSGFVTRLTGLCSSWLCCQPQEKGQLMISRYQFSLVSPEATKPDLHIGLVHHPLQYLTDGDAAHTEIQFQNNFTHILRGHLHSPKLSAHISPDKGYIECAAGCLYGGGQYPNSFQLLTIDYETKSVEAETWLWSNYNWIVDRNVYDGKFRVDLGQARSASRTADNNSSSATTAKVSNDIPASELSILDAPPAVDVAASKLALVPRYPLSFEKQHLSIRKTERREAETTIERHRVAFIEADWGAGSKPFVGALVNHLDRIPASEVFHLNCDSVATVDSLQDAVNHQFGMSLQAFCRWCGVLTDVFVVLDDLGSALLAEKGADGTSTFDRLLKTVLEFCPTLRFVLIGVSAAGSSLSGVSISLRPLDHLQIREYLLNHHCGAIDIKDIHQLDRIAVATDGLPSSLDELAQSLSVLSLDEAILRLADEDGSSTAVAAEAPSSLLKQIRSLRTSTDETEKRAYRLLMALTVLEAGECLETIRRMNPAAPFFEKHAELLLEKSLIEAMAVPDLAVSGNSIQSPKLLKVPRVIREVVRSELTEPEIDETTRLAANAMLGQGWRHGTIKLSKRALAANRDSGPGNEFIVCRRMLKGALAKNDLNETQITVTALIKYLHVLMDSDRFHDGYFVASEVLSTIEPFQDTWDGDMQNAVIELKRILAECARMIDRAPEAVVAFNSILASKKHDYGDEQLCDLLSSLALAYEDTGETDELISVCRVIIAKADKKSHDYFQAKGLLVEYELSGDDREKSMRGIESRARRVGQDIVAENIALARAEMSESLETVKDVASSVIRTSDSFYNRLRATLLKVRSLITAGLVSEVSKADRATLERGYTIMFTQRMGSLFDKCHSCLWAIHESNGDWEVLVNIFRYSSFLWRLRGNQEMELRCLNRVVEGAGSLLVFDEPRRLRFEMRYLSERQAALACN